MSKQIVSQIEQRVKCADEWCGEPVFRDGLCFDHFIEIETQAWDDQDAGREMVLGTIGHIISPRCGGRGLRTREVLA